MMDSWRLADLHAYVDDCLEPEHRKAFERKMANDPALERRVAAWAAQNRAIRSAFDAEGTGAFSISIARPQNENWGKSRRSASVGGKPLRERPAETAMLGRSASGNGRARATRIASLLRLSLAAICGTAIYLLAPGGLGVQPPFGLGDAGVAAFRAFINPNLEPVELAGGEARQLQLWLSTRLSRPVYVPQTPPALSLVGARVAPARDVAAGFLVYSLQNQFIGLLVLPLDDPRSTAPELVSVGGRYLASWTSGGQAFVLVGDVDPSLLLKVSQEFVAPPDSSQALPARGS
jgi:anti-sigma factor RsiW